MPIIQTVDRNPSENYGTRSVHGPWKILYLRADGSSVFFVFDWFIFVIPPSNESQDLHDLFMAADPVFFFYELQWAQYDVLFSLKNES